MTKILLKNGGYLEITPEQKDRWQKIYKHIDVNHELTSIETCYNTGAIPKQTQKGALKEINFYLKNINEFAKCKYGG